MVSGALSIPGAGNAAEVMLAHGATKYAWSGREGINFYACEFAPADSAYSTVKPLYVYARST
jgi:hypothetical protein